MPTKAPRTVALERMVPSAEERLLTQIFGKKGKVRAHSFVQLGVWEMRAGDKAGDPGSKRMLLCTSNKAVIDAVSAKIANQWDTSLDVRVSRDYTTLVLAIERIEWAQGEESRSTTVCKTVDQDAIALVGRLVAQQLGAELVRVVTPVGDVVRCPTCNPPCPVCDEPTAWFRTVEGTRYRTCGCGTRVDEGPRKRSPKRAPKGSMRPHAG